MNGKELSQMYDRNFSEPGKLFKDKIGRDITEIRNFSNNGEDPMNRFSQGTNAPATMHDTVVATDPMSRFSQEANTSATDPMSRFGITKFDPSKVDVKYDKGWNENAHSYGAPGAASLPNAGVSETLKKLTPDDIKHQQMGNTPEWLFDAKSSINNIRNGEGVGKEVSEYAGDHPWITAGAGIAGALGLGAAGMAIRNRRKSAGLTGRVIGASIGGMGVLPGISNTLGMERGIEQELDARGIMHPIDRENVKNRIGFVSGVKSGLISLLPQLGGAGAGALTGAGIGMLTQDPATIGTLAFAGAGLGGIAGATIGGYYPGKLIGRYDAEKAIRMNNPENSLKTASWADSYSDEELYGIVCR